MAGPSPEAAIGQDHDTPLSPVSPASPPTDNRDIFSDDYAESFNESYAPSILAPSSRHSRSASPSPERPGAQHDQYRTSVNSLISPFADPPTLPRNSVRKSVENVQSATREEARRGVGPSSVTAFGGTANTASAALAHRSVSSASSFAGSQSPSSRAGEGPSHPYAMYPQGLAMSRTASIASTARPLSTSQSARGPSHPYGMYSQTVGEDAPPTAQHSSFTVGFPGSNHSYHRRIGPEGEEQDIVGPDGHTEQLPPYSRYPDEVHHKTIAPPSVLPSIGEQRGEEASSASPTTTAIPNTSNTRILDLGESDVDGQDLNEKKWDQRSTKEKWKTKVFGTPLWLLLLCFVLIVVIAVVLGAVLGAVIANKHHDRGKGRRPPFSPPPWPDQTPSSSWTASSTTTTTAYLDVTSPTTTPTWIYPPPSANYTVDAGSPVANYSGCLPSAQQPAWSCLLHDNTTLLNIGGSDNATIMSLIALNPTLQYGTQPPEISSDQIQLVQDPDSDTYAFAWHFQTTYDKLVVLDLNDGLSPLNTKRRRAAQAPWYATSLQQKQQDDSDDSDDDVDPNDPDNVTDNQAWFCYWNQTFIEVLVYAENSTNGSTMLTGSSSMSLASASSSSPSPYSVATSASTSATATVYTSSISGSLGYDLGPQRVSGLITPSSTTSYSANIEPPWVQTKAVRARDAASPVPSRRIKIEERRVPFMNAPPPTCTLMQFCADGEWRPMIRSNGVIPVVALRESDPTETPMSTSGSPALVRRGAIPTDACGCEWISPDGQIPV